MKELYIAPEMELLCLAPAERLAAFELEFDTLMANHTVGISADPNIDIDVEIPSKK